VKLSKVANSIQIATPKALSSIPPIHTGIPASSDISFIFNEL
ncbi:uncharacterized protein METZ01_LOCUS275580, partial [marine metagenome]